MSIDEVKKYIQTQREAGKSDDFIRDALIKSGWGEEMINSVLYEEVNDDEKVNKKNLTSGNKKKSFYITSVLSAVLFSFIVTILPGGPVAIIFHILMLGVLIINLLKKPKSYSKLPEIIGIIMIAILLAGTTQAYLSLFGFTDDIVESKQSSLTLEEKEIINASKSVEVVSHEIKSHKDPATQYSSFFYTVDGRVQNNTHEEIRRILVTVYEYADDGEFLATYNKLTYGSGRLRPIGSEEFSVRLGSEKPNNYKLYTTWELTFPLKEDVREYVLNESVPFDSVEVTVNSIDKDWQTSAQPYAADVNFVVVNATIKNNSESDIDVGGLMNFFLDDDSFTYNERRDNKETFKQLTIGKDMSLRQGEETTGNLVFQVPQNRINSLSLNIQTFFNGRERARVALD